MFVSTGEYHPGMTSQSEDASPLMRYHEYFRHGDPLTKGEIDFVARWIYESLRFMELGDCPTLRWAKRWDMPVAAIANFHSAFEHHFHGRPDRLFETVWDTPIPLAPVPWLSEDDFLQRDQAVCDWLRMRAPGRVLNVPEWTQRHRSLRCPKA